MLSTPKPQLSVAEILTTVGDRSFGFLIFLLGVPNCVPMPPPIATISSLLLMLVAIQFVLKRESPALPTRILEQRLRVAAMRAAYQRVRPALVRLEGISGRRPGWTGPGAYVLTAILLVALSVGLLTALPVFGQIPWGVAACLLGLALVEHDRVLYAAAITACAIGGLTAYATAYALAEGLQNLF